MENMKCAACGAEMGEGMPHCSQCKATMACADGTCSCTCGNKVAMAEAKCDACLGM